MKKIIKHIIKHITSLLMILVLASFFADRARVFLIYLDNHSVMV